MVGEITESASVLAKRMEKGSHEFVIQHYSMRLKEQPLESDEFVVGGHRWAIRYYPYGTDVSGYASLFFYLKSQSFQPVNVFFKLSILDQTGEGRHLSMSTFGNDKLLQWLTQGSMTGHAQFIRQAMLEFPSSRYLKNDCIKTHLTLGVFKFYNRNQPLVKVPVSNIGADFGKLLKSQRCGDVFYKVGDRTFSAHKLILAARCPLLLSSSSSDADHPLHVSDIEPTIFEAVLWFIYTGTLENESGSSIVDSFAAKMLVAADRFELKRLKQICESRILAAENEAKTIINSDGCHPLLARLRENPSSFRKRVMYVCGKALSTFMESSFGGCLPRDATYMKHKDV